MIVEDQLTAIVAFGVDCEMSEAILSDPNGFVIAMIAFVLESTHKLGSGRSLEQAPSFCLTSVYHCQKPLSSP